MIKTTETQSIGRYSYGPDNYGGLALYVDGKLFGDGIAPEYIEQAIWESVTLDGFCPHCFFEEGVERKLYMDAEFEPQSIIDNGVCLECRRTPEDI